WPSHRRRLAVLWARPGRSLPACPVLRRSHPQRREASRPAGASADQVRARHQPQNRQGARPRNSSDRARPRRRGDRMNRRAFITLLGGAAVAWLSTARAQKIPLIAWLDGGGQPRPDSLIAFRSGLNNRGYVDGRNVVIRIHGVEQPEQL